MAKSSSVRRWLEDLRYETEAYDPQMQETASIAWRFARASWSPDGSLPHRITTEVVTLRETHSSRNTKSRSSGSEYTIDGDETINNNHSARVTVTPPTENDVETDRKRLITVSIPQNTVSNNVKKFNNEKKLQELILRRNQQLQLPGELIKRPLSHQQPKQPSYLHRVNSNTNPVTIIREGAIDRAKIVNTNNNNNNKGGKHWKTGMYAILTDRAIFFIEDGESLLSMKSGASSGADSLKDKVNLSDGVRILQDIDRHHSTKKNVLAISNRNGALQALMQNDQQELSDSWFKDISNVIAKHVSDAGEGNTGSLPNAKTVLNWFFKKRPNKETLVSQGIYKNEPIFGNTLERLFEASDKKRPIPAFVQRCTNILENPPHVLSVGLYRTSGNLSHIQKLRLRVDQNDTDALEDPSMVNDSDVLAGALKLFFRELQHPLIPYQTYMQLSDACTHPDCEKRFALCKEALKNMPLSHFETLGLLCRHLLRITVHERQNQMSAANLGIVWGPSFTWPDEGSGTRALHLCTDVNRIVQYLIEESAKIFVQ